MALAYRRKDVHAINQSTRSARRSGDDLTDEQMFKTTHGKRAFAKEDRILLTRNDRNLGVRNGMLGTVRKVGDDQITFQLDGDGNKPRRMVTITPETYPHFDHGYASAIHKSQGATLDRTFVLGSSQMDRYLTYVAMTRHKEETTLYGNYNSLQKMRRCGEENSRNHQRNRDKSKQRHHHSQRRKRGPTLH